MNEYFKAAITEVYPRIPSQEIRGPHFGNQSCVWIFVSILGPLRLFPYFWFI